ncbi:transglycosylase family protein [Thermoleophilum album]|uniref:Putative peptidoglycan binding domain-containing protein n=1 Tax=Thermoleophilum album TaxID=29539 RepID=A0A1H6FX55_THEAL|nr:transglycosylase family protein [Thermoleophilum album]SEH15389.1 Putative peptidoglycan binding domain-containing protein [Thermoleophilum album]
MEQRSRHTCALASRRRIRRRLLAVLVVAFQAVAVGLAAEPVAAGAGGGAGAPPVGAPLLSLGSYGDAVRALQVRLRTPFRDGLYDTATRAAVRRFQRRAGLPATGLVDYLTARKLRVDMPARAASVRRPVPRIPPELERIADCESGGNPAAIGGGGAYRGKYQFTLETWRRLGGWGDPARAAEWIQDLIALRLWRLEGGRPWPTCSSVSDQQTPA